MLRRAVAEHARELDRAALLPAYVEVMLALGDADAAAAAARQLQEIADRQASDLLGAQAAQARAAVLIASGKDPEALTAARRAGQAWRTLAAPYDAARARVLLAQVLRALQDEESAQMELEAARTVFVELEAAPDVAQVDALMAITPAAGAHGLSVRELEVLRHLARGSSNREIATALVISEHTVARHLQNMFAKLDLPSRAAATAYAYRHGLV